jgi:23S rRNA (uracil1939-C5)-methyltransferase
MVVIVSATPVFPARNNFVKALLKEQPEITTIIHNINKTDTNLFITEDSRVLYGKGYIEDILCGKRFRISPSSFYQVNPVQCEVLYNTAMEFAGLDGTQTVFDAYCGTGTIGLIASDKARQVLGVELNKEAVRDAISNARLNSIKNCYFKCADAGEFIDVLVKENERFDIAFLDPPRAGSTPKFLNALIRLRPERIVYISCNPQTLARDLKQLSKAYKVKRIQGVDMFPFTKHIEAVALLEKR